MTIQSIHLDRIRSGQQLLNPEDLKQARSWSSLQASDFDPHCNIGDRAIEAKASTMRAQTQHTKSDRLIDVTAVARERQLNNPPIETIGGEPIANLQHFDDNQLALQIPNLVPQEFSDEATGVFKEIFRKSKTRISERSLRQPDKALRRNVTRQNSANAADGFDPIRFGEQSSRILQESPARSVLRETHDAISDAGFIHELINNRARPSAAAASDNYREVITSLDHLRNAASEPVKNHAECLLPTPWHPTRVIVNPATFREELHAAIASSARVPAEFRYSGLRTHGAIEFLIDDKLSAIETARQPEPINDMQIEGIWRHFDAWLHFWCRLGSGSDGLFEVIIRFRRLDRETRADATLLKLDDGWGGVKDAHGSVAASNFAAAVCTGPYRADQESVLFRDLTCIDFPHRWALCAAVLGLHEHQASVIPLPIAIDSSLEEFQRPWRRKSLEFAGRFGWIATERFLAAPIATSQCRIRAGAGIVEGLRIHEIAVKLFITLTLIGAAQAQRALSGPGHRQWPAGNRQIWRRARAFELIAIVLDDGQFLLPQHDDVADAGRSIAQHVIFNRPRRRVGVATLRLIILSLANFVTYPTRRRELRSGQARSNFVDLILRIANDLQRNSQLNPKSDTQHASHHRQ